MYKRVQIACARAAASTRPPPTSEPTATTPRHHTECIFQQTLIPMGNAGVVERRINRLACRGAASRHAAFSLVSVFRGSRWSGVKASHVCVCVSVSVFRIMYVNTIPARSGLVRQP